MKIRALIVICLTAVGMVCAAQAKVNINTASVAELETLPRIGPGLAKSIVDYREVNGPFRSIEDIKNVPRIGDQTFTEIRDLITVGDGTVPAVHPEPSRTRDLPSPMEPISKETPTPAPTATPEPTVDEIMGHFIGEPSITDVQRAAVRFAEIDPLQFASWRRNARLKGLIPNMMQITVGHDTDDDTDYTRSKSISLSGGTVTIGPDDESWGHDTDEDWDYELKLRWNLQDYVFNSDMLRVTSETEDQMGFRQDVLNEVTKLYFDRRRQQIDTVLNPPRDIQSKMKSIIRLEELTATLDGLTGGYFSAELAKMDTRQIGSEDRQ